MVAQWVRLAREWWGHNWLRFHAVMTPIGSGLVTLWLSQSESVGWLWNSPTEYVVAAKFASAGILFYTGSFAVLETGVWLLMVLALMALDGYIKRTEQRRQGLIALGIALGVEAQRRSQATGKPVPEVLKELEAENWQPPES